MTRGALYNEIEPYAARWMENLIDAGYIAEGRVERRSIVCFEPRDLDGVTQFHAFAGTGAWSYALRLARWADDWPVWTGSCPCQPFSQAGRGAGFADARHLWPEWFRLIRACRPAVVFGEQVASPAGLAWFDLVSADLEGAAYAVRAFDLCAAGVGAPHIRQRLYFVALADGERLERVRLHVRAGRSRSAGPEARRCGQAGGLGHAGSDRVGQHARQLRRDEAEYAKRAANRDHAPVAAGAAGELADAARARSARRLGDELLPPGRVRFDDGRKTYWSVADWLPCTDGVSRPVEPGAFPLAHRASARVGRLRAYGNGIVPQVAAELIAAVMDALTSDGRPTTNDIGTSR